MDRFPDEIIDIKTVNLMVVTEVRNVFTYYIDFLFILFKGRLDVFIV